jgi:hypothetical protein
MQQFHDLTISMPFPFQIHNQLFPILTQFLWLELHSFKLSCVTLLNFPQICDVILTSSATHLQINRRVFKMGRKSKELSEDRKQLVVDQDSLKLCSSFYYNEKHWWQFQLALPIAAIFLFSRILMRQHCIYIYIVIVYWGCRNTGRFTLYFYEFMNMYLSYHYSTQAAIGSASWNCHQCFSL